MLKTAWRLEKRIFHNIEKHENQLFGKKKWPKNCKQQNKLTKS